jgi:hypothetical protein
MGELDYDFDIAAGQADEQWLGTADTELPLHQSKEDFIMQLLQKRNLSSEQVVFVDDDIQEIDQVQNVCLTIHITGKGIAEPDIEILRRMLF